VPENKDLKRLVRERMAESGERYTTALDVVRADRPTSPSPAELVQRLADKTQRIEAMRLLVGGITATEMRQITTLPDDVFEALLAGLQDSHPQIRFWCVQLLDHVPEERALLPVAALLDDPVPRVRRNAAHALGCLACKPTADINLPADVVDRLAALAEHDPNARVRQTAAASLACRRPAPD
jgi:HEAT repeat protein